MPVADQVTVNGKLSDCIAVMTEVPVKGELLIGDLATGFRPVLLGAMVGAGIAQRTLVADSRMMGLTVTPDGRLLTLPYGPPSDRGLTTPVTTVLDTAAHALITARATGIKISLWAMHITSLNTNNTTLTLSCPSLGTLGVFGVPGTQIVPGGYGPWPLPLQTGAAEALNYQSSNGAAQLVITPFWFITRD